MQVLLHRLLPKSWQDGRNPSAAWTRTTAANKEVGAKLTGHERRLDLATVLHSTATTISRVYDQPSIDTAMSTSTSLTTTTTNNNNADNVMHLVGVGPGDPELLTVKAVRLLRSAELVVADYLTSPEVLALCSPQCEIRTARKRSKKMTADQAQDEMNQWCLEGLRLGRRVVRLKGGDPFLYGRGGEELLFFRKHGFQSSVVPGISSCMAAPLSAGIPVTHRAVANEFMVCTARLRGGAVPDLPPYSPTRTTVFLMAVGKLPELSAAMMAAGFPPSCPAALVERGTQPEERVARGTVATIASVAVEHAIKAPAVLVVGDCVEVLQ